MSFFEVLLIGCALAMDACAVAMTNGMTERKMPFKKALLIGGFFGFFQFLMPLIGYFITGIVANAFMQTFEKIAAWVSFGLLAVLGGKMVYESVREMRCNARAKRAEQSGENEPIVCEMRTPLTLSKLTVQAIATSIDALAVGVTLQMAVLNGGLFGGAFGSTLLIGGVTLILSVGAVYIGRAIGDKLADKAGLLGGLVLVGIGVKLLIEGLM